MSQYNKEYYQAHKDKFKEYRKSYYNSHKKENTVKCKAYRESHKEEFKDYQKEWHKAYYKSDVNSFGKTKGSIRRKSNYYLKKHGTKIEGYEIHHCCTYTEPYKFIYCSKEIHQLIHYYLRQHNIDADTDHYEQIKHLLDDKVVLYGLE